MRLKDVEMAVDQFGRAVGHLVSEMDPAAMRLDRVALERDLACDVALRILVVLPLDIDAGPDLLDRVHGIGGVIDRDPIDVFERRQHLRAHFGIEDRPAGSFVDEAIRRDGDDKDVAELACGFQMTNVPEVKQVESAMSLNDHFAAGTSLVGDPAKLLQRPHLVARTVHRRRRLAVQLCDVGFQVPRPFRLVLPEKAEPIACCLGNARLRSIQEHHANSLYYRALCVRRQQNSLLAASRVQP